MASNKKEHRVMKDMNALAKELCRREGKKVQVNIAQMKEILRCLSDMFVEEPNLCFKIYQWASKAVALGKNDEPKNRNAPKAKVANSRRSDKASKKSPKVVRRPI